MVSTMAISKDDLMKQFPGVVITGELNPDIPDSQWLFSAGLAQVIADCAKSRTTKVQQLFVYCLQKDEENVFKIGITSNMKSRLDSLQTACPGKLHVVKCVKSENAKKVEQKILEKLKDFSVGGEWVACDKKIVLRTFNNVIRLDQAEI